MILVKEKPTYLRDKWALLLSLIRKDWIYRQIIMIMTTWSKTKMIRLKNCFQLFHIFLCNMCNFDLENEKNDANSVTLSIFRLKHLDD